MTTNSKKLTRCLDKYTQIKACWSEYSSNDVDDVCEKVTSVFCEHKLTPNGKHKELDYSHRILTGKSISLIRMCYGNEVSVQTNSLHDHFIIPMPIEGVIEYKSGDNIGVVSSSSAFIPKLDEQYSFTMSADCDAVIVRINRATLEHKLTKLLQNTFSRPLDFDVCMPLNLSTGKIWITALRNYIEYLYLTRNSNTVQWLLREQEDLLMMTLLHAQHHNYTSVLENQFENVKPRHVKLAENYLQENASSNVDIGEVTSFSGVGVRGLRAAFYKYHGCTPLQYLRSIRLEHVYAELVAAGLDETVTNVATRWGFNHLGRFAATYKKRFGETPLETLKRAQNRLP